jgi:twitching motility protein PilT
MALSLSDLLKRMLEMSGSDLHLTTNSPPQIRVHGHLVPLDLPQMTPSETKQLAYSVMTDSQKHRFEENLELDFSFGLKGLALIPFEIKSFNQLGLPAVVSKMCDKPRGLVLVTGPTGSGKSTTLAAMIDKINTERHDHILTIEDPIEFVHMNKNCVVNQRELHADTKSFADALRAALREDPDVVLIGEMRDLETIESALRIAETGHLTFGTLHTNSASSTINRIIDVFPSHQQSQIRAQLSLVLEGIMCQTLLPKSDGKGRAMCMEILVPNAAVRNLIREDKIHQIYSSMQSGQDKFGMQTFNQALATAYFQKQITLEMAMSRSSNQDELTEMINRGATLLNRNQSAPAMAKGASPAKR